MAAAWIVCTSIALCAPASLQVEGPPDSRFAGPPAPPATGAVLQDPTPAAAPRQGAAQTPEKGHQMPPHPEVYKPLEIHILGGVWFPRLNGKVQAPDGAGEIDVARQMDMDDQEATPNLELYIKKHEFWEIILSGYNFETSQSSTFVGSGSFNGLTLNPGDPFSSTFKMRSASMELGITPWRPYAKGHSRDMGIDNRTWDGHYICDLTFSPQFGFRWIGLEQTINGVTAGSDFAAFTVGLDITLKFRPEIPIPAFRMIELQAAAAAGPAFGGDGGVYWQVRAGITWHFIDQLGFTVAYRLSEVNVSSDDFSFNGGLQGLFIGGSIRF